MPLKMPQDVSGCLILTPILSILSIYPEVLHLYAEMPVEATVHKDALVHTS